MESLREHYDHIFFNESRISQLIDDYSETSKEKLDVLGTVINHYIVCRGKNVPGTSPMSMFIVISKFVKSALIKDVINDLAEEECPVVVQNSKGYTYISLY